MIPGFRCSAYWRVRGLLLVLCFLQAVLCFSVEKLIIGKVVDKNHKSIPYAIVEQPGRYAGLYCDEDGVFSTPVNPDSVKQLLIYARGYEAREVLIEKFGEDTFVIQLTEKARALREVAISSKRTKKAKVKEGVLGRRKLSCNGAAYMTYGEEVAIYLEAIDPKRISYLKDIFVYITNEGIPNSKFRIHVYDEDTATGEPLNDITDSILVAHADKGDEWVSVNVSNLRIPVKNGIFISVEWLSGYGNNPGRIAIEHPRQYHTGGHGFKYAPNYYNGQVLGETWKYGIQFIAYSRSPQDNGEWKYIALPGLRRKYMPHWINPMIYCTYTYSNQ